MAHLHLKDIDGAKHAQVLAERIDFDTAMLDGIFCPVGEGIVDFKAFKDALEDAGYEGWATVEQDHEPSDPDKSVKAFDGAVKSLEYLQAVGLG